MPVDRTCANGAAQALWKFGARTEAMAAQQRRLFEDTLIEDEAGLRVRLAALQAGLPETPKPPKAPRTQPRRQALAEHLQCVEHHHEPENTNCPTPECDQPMQRVGQDVSEKLDIVPAKFFVHRHIYGKWACRCWTRAGARPRRPTSGPTPEVSSMRTRLWSTSSAPGPAGGSRWPSSVDMGRRKGRRPGKAHC